MTEGQITPDLDKQWIEIAKIVADAMEKIDEDLTKANVPISSRKARALQIFVAAWITIPGDYLAFMASEAYARIFSLADSWFQKRYGEELLSEKEYFASVAVIHGSAFLLDVPLQFSKPGDEPGTVWFGVPASVQPEEKPLTWIKNGPNPDSLNPSKLEEAARWTANKIRSIHFDLRTVSYGNDQQHAATADMISANLKAAALDLCARDAGRLRNAGWEISQAVEKMLKLYLMRHGQKPEWTHVLSELADEVDKHGGITVDRAALARIPSGSQATGLRYGGNYSIVDALAAYDAALELIEPLALKATVKSEYNVREARFLLKTPPWFEYDTKGFLAAIEGASG